MSNYNNPLQQTEANTLGRYRLLRLIGRGGMGEVWLAEDPILHRQVAIKTLPMHSLSDREFSQRFEREAQAAASLNHPHILPVHDYGQQALPDGQIITYIVLPYLTGGSLSDRIAAYSARRIPMSPQEAISYLSQAAEAIDYAHERGIIHRDIKPGNMLLRSDNWLMLADFGIARMLASSERLTQQGIGMGTPEYVAPEQAQGKAEFASDNYSLAVIAYQLFTGQLPFQADTGYAITIQHMTMPPPSPRQINPNLSLAIEVVLLRSLTKQPGERYPGCRVFVGELQRALSNAPYEGTYIKPTVLQTDWPSAAATMQSNQQGQTDSKPSSTAPVSKKGVITRRRMLIGGAAVAAVVLGGSGLAYWVVTHRQSVTSHPPNSSSPPDTPLLIQGKHNKPVATLAFSPAGNAILASAGEGEDGLVYLWDVADLFQRKGQLLQEKASLRTQNVSAMLLIWSPQGDMLAIGNAGNSSINVAPITVYKGDLSDYAPGFDDKFGVHGTTSIEGLSWTPSQYIYAVIHPFDLNSFNLNVQDQLYMWDPAQPQKSFAPVALPSSFENADSNIVNIGNQKYVHVASNPLQLAPYDTTLLAMGTNKGILIGKVAQGNKLGWSKQSMLTFNPDNQFAPTDVGAISWSHAGKLLAAIPYGLQEPTSVTVFDMQKQTLTALDEPVDNQSPLTSMVWCPKPSSTLIAAGTKDGRIYIWDYQGSTLPQNTLSAPQGVMGVVKALAWSPDGQWLAAAYSDANATIAIWKL